MDPISAMRMTAAGRITPFNPPVLGQGQEGAGGFGDLQKLGQSTAEGLQKISESAADSLQKLGPIGPARPLSFGPAGSGRSFSDFLGEVTRDVTAKQAAASEAVAGVLSGEGVPLHQAMIAVEEAGVSFQLMVEVRNKLLESYQELMRMQI